MQNEQLCVVEIVIVVHVTADARFLLCRDCGNRSDNLLSLRPRLFYQNFNHDVMCHYIPLTFNLPLKIGVFTTPMMFNTHVSGKIIIREVFFLFMNVCHLYFPIIHRVINLT